MISNIWPGIITPYSPHTAFFTRSSAIQGLPDNLVRGQTVAEMFEIPTSYPVYLTVVVPNNCVIADHYGFHDTTGIYTYEPTTEDYPGALRFDDLHADSIVYIINNGVICGAGGDGGMGYSYYAGIVNQSDRFNRYGSGGGGGRGWFATRGGMAPIGSWFLLDPDHGEPGGGVTATDGNDGSFSAAGARGGTRDVWTSDVSPTTWGSTFGTYSLQYENDADFTENYNGWAILEALAGQCVDYQEEGSEPFVNTRMSAGGAGHLPHHTDWKAAHELAGCTYTPEMPGYVQAAKALYLPQDGTAAIVLGCKTFIHNSEKSGVEGIIAGGGGGGAGGDNGAVMGLGFDGGDWGDDGEGPNDNGVFGGNGGKAVHKNSNELTWVAGNFPGVQVFGDVT